MPFADAHDASDSVASSLEESHNGLFCEPDGYFPPTPPPTTQTYTLISPSTAPLSGPANRDVTLHLVGYSPTETHRLWNGSRIISEYLETNPAQVRDKTVLELGAGAGLPSLLSAILGAKKVVMTDYPDAQIVQTMWRNIDECALIPRRPKTAQEDGTLASALSSTTGHASPSGDERAEDQDIILAKGFVWGADPMPLLSALSKDDSSSKKFDVLILADLLFRHDEHENMLKTVRETMAPGGKALVFFTSYRPWLQHKDLAFFDLARERGFVVDKLLEKKMDKPMFEDDPGDEEVRKTCTGWVVRWPSEEQ